MRAFKHKFPYEWKLSEIKKVSMPYHGKKVFSCFAGGGGSSMGYKLAGYDVVGCNEIDDRMSLCYEKNLKPQMIFKEDIRDLPKKKLPKELHNLDILDGSPPCTLFSIANTKRREHWGKEKKFREGQKKQILDTLFFDFIRLAGSLRPKVVIAENVMGMLKGDTIQYVQRIIGAFKDTGYLISIHRMNAGEMGLPQERRRLIFTAIRDDLVDKVIKTKGLVDKEPIINFSFRESKIAFKKVIDKAKTLKEIKTNKRSPSFAQKNWDLIKPGQSFSILHPRGSFFNLWKMPLDVPVPTLTTSAQNNIHPIENRPINVREFQLCSSFPLDYDFLNKNPYYIMGMSVPPIMMAQIAWVVKHQWLDKIK